MLAPTQQTTQTRAFNFSATNGLGFVLQLSMCLNAVLDQAQQLHGVEHTGPHACPLSVFSFSNMPAVMEKHAFLCLVSYHRRVLHIFHLEGRARQHGQSYARKQGPEPRSSERCSFFLVFCFFLFFPQEKENWCYKEVRSMHKKN